MEIVVPAIEAYAAAHTTSLPPLLQELQGETERRMGRAAGMLSGQTVGMLLQTIIAAMGARRVLEIGTFTGLSAQLMAAALPDDGELITCDVDPDAIALASTYLARSPHRHKIHLREGPALETLRTLTGPFDFVFIDADKENYRAYYEAVLPLLAPRGVIAVDNVLWGGDIVAPRTAMARMMAEFNDHVQQDPRVTNVLVTIRDGVMLIRKREGGA